MIQILMDQITQVVGPYIPRIAAALGILVVGWLIALIIAAIVRGLLRRTTIDNRLAAWFAGDELAKEVHLEEWVGKGIYYLVLQSYVSSHWSMGVPDVLTVVLSGSQYHGQLPDTRLQRRLRP